MKYTTEVVIYRSRNVVFEYLTNPEKLKYWVQGFIDSTSPDKLAIDSPYRQLIRVGRHEEEMRGHVSRYQANQLFETVIITHVSRTKTLFELHPHDGNAATRLCFTEEIQPLTLLSKIMVRVLSRATQNKQMSELNRLKVFLDRGGDKA